MQTIHGVTSRDNSFCDSDDSIGNMILMMMMMMMMVRTVESKKKVGK